MCVRACVCCVCVVCLHVHVGGRVGVSECMCVSVGMDRWVGGLGWVGCCGWVSVGLD